MNAMSTFTVLQIFWSISGVSRFGRIHSSKLLVTRVFTMAATSGSASVGEGPSGSGSLSPSPAKRNSIGHGPHDRSKCLFCRISDGTDPNSSKDKIVYQNDELVVFPDIRPAAKYHFLVVSKEHIRDSKHLVESQIGLLDRMVQTGNQVLSTAISASDSPHASIPKTLMGFHWPPFHTVSHLHLHVIAPSDSMGFVGRLIFRPNSYWFVQPEWVRERLQKMNSGTTS